MYSETKDIAKILIDLLKENVPPLKIKAESAANIEVSGTKVTIQGRHKVDGIYFASVVTKPKDVRLYFFPTYTHAGEFAKISDALKKCKTGKSCFHIKKLDEELIIDIKQMINKGVSIYKKDKLI